MMKMILHHTNIASTSLSFFLGLILLTTSIDTHTATAWSFSPPLWKKITKQAPSSYDYDLCVIGAGASGMFAAGTAASLGYSTLLLDRAYDTTKAIGTSCGTRENGDDSTKAEITSNDGRVEFHVGGDCTNSACVPSKAVRSIARMASSYYTNADVISSSSSESRTDHHDKSAFRRWIELAQCQSMNTVSTVRNRESPSRIAQSSSKLDFEFVQNSHFISPYELNLSIYDNSTWLEGSINVDHENIKTNSTKQGTTAPITNRIITSRKFLIATGSSPVVPEKIKQAAETIGIPMFTYRTLLRPSQSILSTGKEGQSNCNTRSPLDETIWDILNETNTNFSATSSFGVNKKKQLVIVGGGASACELGQSLGRLICSGADSSRWDVSLVAPSILPTEDVSLQQAAMQLLTRDGVKLHLGVRGTDLIKSNDGSSNNNTLSSGKLVLSTEKSKRDKDTALSIPVDALVLCLGRAPDLSLKDLQLHNADVAWTPTSGGCKDTSSSGRNGGVTVNTYLRSKSTPRVYACGDCASVVPLRDRRAVHAGWTGFHAVRNALMPPFLWFLRSPAIHPVVPRVVYTDPELASAGLSYEECVRQYGSDGFDCLRVREDGTDRADVESLERSAKSGFIELRSTKVSGRILGATICGPTASELINEICLAIVSKLTVRDLAQTLHSYPSHGYLMYRVALGMAMKSISGLLAGCGRSGQCLSVMIRAVQQFTVLLRQTLIQATPPLLPHWWKLQKARDLKKQWEGDGSTQTLEFLGPATADSRSSMTHFSYIDIYKNKTLCEEVLDLYNTHQESKQRQPDDTMTYMGYDPVGIQDFATWFKKCPE